MAENSKIEELCVYCSKPTTGHYHGETGLYCIGFYDSTKVFTTVLAAGGA